MACLITIPACGSKKLVDSHRYEFEQAFDVHDHLDRCLVFAEDTE
jgi:hypothetical protein